jgi:FkbM family methyltransferase
MKLTVRNGLVILKRLVKVCAGRDLFLREQVAVPRERYGSEYGGWWVHPVGMGPNSVVYSVGVGDDVTFDLSLIQTFGHRVHAFDPTPRSIAWMKDRQFTQMLEFRAIGLADFDGEAEFQPPANNAHMSYSIRSRTRGRADRPVLRANVMRLSSIMRLLGHEKVDLLKMDIEGAEYTVIQDLLKSRAFPGQILVEFHHGRLGCTAGQTREAVDRLNHAGYRIFAVSSSGRECSFLRTR